MIRRLKMQCPPVQPTIYVPILKILVQIPPKLTLSSHLSKTESLFYITRAAHCKLSYYSTEVNTLAIKGRNVSANEIRESILIIKKIVSRQLS